MTIALGKDVEDFPEEQVRAGVCRDAAELANDVLRSICEITLLSFPSSPELEAWLPQAAEHPTSALIKADFDGIRHRAVECNPSNNDQASFTRVRPLAD